MSKKNKRFMKPEVEINEGVVSTKEIVETEEGISAVEETTHEVVDKKYGIVVNCESLRMRTEPNTNASVICLIDADMEVSIIGEQNAFYQVEFDGKTGYCMKQFIEC